jgi:Putative peptidoglycan binding domain
MSEYAEGGAAWLSLASGNKGPSPARDIRKSPACVMAAKRKRNDVSSMKKLRLLSLVGITSIALTHAAWAGPHGGGGGGFGGGGFSGGGHVGGGGGRAGPVGGGGGFRGGGVSFGGARFSGGGQHFAGRTGMSGVRPPVFSRPGRIPNSRPALSNAPHSRGAMPSSVRQPQTLPQRGLNGRTDHIAERHSAANWHGDWDRRHAHFDRDRFFVFVDGFWCGLDAGFFPWDYYPYYAYDYYPYDYYTDVPPGDNTGAAYNGVPVADPTVQDVQTQLTQLGYYNGPADGFFGPTTRDAVAKYQIAKKLNVTGSLSPDVLQSLGLPQAAGS